MNEAFRLYLLPKEMLEKVITEIKEDIDQLEVSIKYKRNLVQSLESRILLLEQMLPNPAPKQFCKEEVKVLNQEIQFEDATYEG